VCVCVCVVWVCSVCVCMCVVYVCMCVCVCVCMRGIRYFLLNAMSVVEKVKICELLLTSEC